MTDFAPLRVSTAALPVRDRIPFWREVVGREYCHVDIEPLVETPLESKVSLRALPGLRSIEYESAPARVQRTREFVSDGDDSFTLLINLSGAATFSQRKREVSFNTGEAVLILHAEPGTLSHSQIHETGVAVPRAALAAIVANIEDEAMRVIPHANDALRLLTGYLNMVHESLPLATPELRHRVATHVQDLIAIAIGSRRSRPTSSRISTSAILR